MYQDHRRRRNDNNSAPSFLIMSLLYQIFRHLNTLPVKPPATIVLLFLNIYPHLYKYVNVFGYYLSDIRGNCLKPSDIIWRYNLYGFNYIPYNRLFLSAFIHADDTHLYYNMLSLLWKGCNLERQMKTTRFTIFIIFSLIVSHTLMVSMSYVLSEYFHFDGSLSGYNSCAVGFSAALFSMKYVWNQYHCELSNIWGINIQSKYACWLELIIISIITPNASFIGHLAGILAGIFYMKLSRQINMIDTFINSLFLPTQRRYTYTRGYATQ